MQVDQALDVHHGRAGRGDRASRPARPEPADHRHAAGERPHAAADASSLQPNGGGARATVAAQGNAVGRTARVTLQRLDCRCRPTKRTLRLTRTPRRFDSRGRPVRVTVSLPGFFAGEIPYRGLTMVRTLS